MIPGWCCCSVTQSCLTLCNPMDYSMPGLPVPHHLPSLPKFMSFVLVIPSSHLILWHPLLLLPSIFPASRTFPVSQLFTSGDQNIEASASASVLPMSIQSWCPLGLTGLISLLSKGLSKSLLQHHNLKASILSCSAFFMVQLSHPCMTTRKP